MLRPPLRRRKKQRRRQQQQRRLTTTTMATFLFVQRGTNPVYNVLPDIVGRLSLDENLAPVEYRKIMGE